MRDVPTSVYLGQSGDVLGGGVSRRDDSGEAVAYDHYGYPVTAGGDRTGAPRAFVGPATVLPELPEPSAPAERPDPETLLDPLAGLNELQGRHGRWADRNFGSKPYAHRGAYMGVVEEAGELMEALVAPFLLIHLGRLGRSLLKSDQNIRGGKAENDAKAKDAVGDIIMFLLDLCNRKGWVIGDILGRVAAEVHARDWTAKPETGA